MCSMEGNDSLIKASYILAAVFLKSHLPLSQAPWPPRTGVAPWLRILAFSPLGLEFKLRNPLPPTNMQALYPDHISS